MIDIVDVVILKKFFIELFNCGVVVVVILNRLFDGKWYFDKF